MLDVNRLRILHEVVRSGSFSAAARALRITPSAVSQQIAALERSVGLDVVIRSPRGVRVTEPGRLLSEAMTDVIARLAQVERQLAGYADGLGGRLGVATFPSAGQALLPHALTPLTGRPGVEVVVREAETEDAIPLVRSGEVDLALVYHFHTAAPPRDWLADLTYVPLFEEQLYAVVPARHRLAERDVIELGELADEPWIHGVGSCGAYLEQLCSSAGFQPWAACRSADCTFAQMLVAGGVGVAVLPSLAIVPDTDGVRVLAVDPAPTRQVGLVRRTGVPQPPLAAELTRLLRATADSAVIPAGRGRSRADRPARPAD